MILQIIFFYDEWNFISRMIFFTNVSNSVLSVFIFITLRAS